MKICSILLGYSNSGHNDISLHTYQNGKIKTVTIPSADKDVRQQYPS